MPMIGDMKTSKFLKHSDLGEDGEAIFTIVGVSEENAGTEQQPDMKWALIFRGIDKPMILNWTNMQLCAAAFGSENTDDWIGKRILVWYDPSVMYMGELKGGLRVRKISKATAAADAAEAAQRAPREREPGEDDVPWPPTE